ncbi:MAG: DUF4199 domain-containing protein [Flavobacteriales bacterium]|nr:DUF4199 domain-containing protein [Flavobacteriales bacterium]
MKKTVLKYGLIGGAIVSLFMACTVPFMDENSDMSNSELIGYASMLVALSTIFVGIRNYRNKELNGIISFGKAFLIGLYIALIASTLYVLTWMVISDLFLPDFMETYINTSVANMKGAGSTQAEINAHLETMKTWAEVYKNPIYKALMTYMEILPVGILVSLISSFILKKKQS